MMKMSSGHHVKYPLFLSDFISAWIFSTTSLKILRHQVTWKSVLWEPSWYMWIDGRTDRHDEANSRLSCDIPVVLDNMMVQGSTVE